MNKYIVYFEIFGKRLKTTVEASNENHAKEIIKNKIDFHKIEKVNEPDFFQEMGEAIGKLGKLLGVKSK